MMTDGFQCFKRARRGKASAWPVILINYGKPVTERMRIENIIPFALIPGPNQPKDFNSFLFPLKTDLDQLSIGVQAYDSIPRSLFLLRAYLVVAIGDMQAVKHFSCMKGPGGMRPCRICTIQGVYHRGRRKYYVPLRTPNGQDNPRRHYTPESLPPRTATQILQQLQELRNEPRVTARNNLAKEFGLNGESVLNAIPGFSRILGYPHEYMHLLFENIIPMMVCLWKGDFHEVDNTDQPYVISEEDWEEIGRLTEDSNRSIPASFCRLIPNIHKDQNLYTAEAYSFWFMHMAPTLLRGRFKEECYYRHAMLLVKIIEKCLMFEMELWEIDNLEVDIRSWVQKFER
jgi:Transposase family tnp2